MKVIVNHDLCEGNARCVAAAPEVFELQDDDQAKVLIEHPAESYRQQVERAVRLCPRQAVAIVEDA
jgi:ferredoxin